ncbi:hypothetical protein [Burkholderia cenocepacia]|uniref:hypothetical protein n=1 Tax=Burkholderia cenocepacia TaxID=95486 RepID=UPI00264D3B87|nr:hypothetical protein [Burkholderia cenocepacia]MDN7629694.1 hypothetical protein [Burkholderia cenocepacia]
MQIGQDNPETGSDPTQHEAAELLLRFARTLVSPQVSQWGRARCIDLIDALLDLATRRGFRHVEPLRKMLDTDLHGDDTRRLAQAAFKTTHNSELLAVLQESGFHVWLRGTLH